MVAGASVKPGVSFSNIVAGNQPIISKVKSVPKTSNSNSILGILDGMAYEHFKCSYRILESKFLNFMNQYGNIDEHGKEFLLLDFIFDIRNNV